LAAALLLALGAAPALASRNSSGCASVPVSAIDQYCELLPAATGGNAPTPGSPAVGTELPARIVRHIDARPARRRLLTIPIPSRHVAIVGPASTNSPWLLLLLVLLAILLILGAMAAARWRRRPHPA
jgi:hypothetical protein